MSMETNEIEVHSVVMEPVQMEVDTSVVDMQLVKNVTFQGEDVSVIMKPDTGRPWKPTKAYWEHKRRVRKLNFDPNERIANKNMLFSKGCTCDAVDVCLWCAHFVYTAWELAAAAGGA